ncbi:hypothetical protein [Anaerovorax sp. IOR16]|uniref:hypothetical protein n=1 Tax=Anaerovorax sp. IOR16 TaxID=2773458 RepID=UPI0019D172D5|nr:hypothetical protein [Anaerovorax sp. IOR16]
MELNNTKKYLSETIDAFDTSFQNECNDLINRISRTFKENGFTDRYEAYYKRHAISLDEFDDFVYEILIKLSKAEQWDFHMMAKMLSEGNCYFIDYYIGRRIHDILINRVWKTDDELEKEII